MLVAFTLPIWLAVPAFVALYGVCWAAVTWIVCALSLVVAPDHLELAAFAYPIFAFWAMVVVGIIGLIVGLVILF